MDLTCIIEITHRLQSRAAALLLLMMIVLPVFSLSARESGDGEVESGVQVTDHGYNPYKRSNLYKGEDPYKDDSNFALKTNLLDYCILMPNVEVEWKCARRWSVALEGQMAWWARERIHKVYRVATVIPEGRFWPIQHSKWHGMYVGVFAGFAYYDLDNANNPKPGHEGEGYMAGISAGYVWPFSSHLSLEAGLGVGYLRLHDKQYRPLDGHFLYQLTKNINYFGPLRLKLQLVWRIPK